MTPPLQHPPVQSGAAASELQRARELLSATAIRALAEDRWRRWRPWLDAPLFSLILIGLTLSIAPAVSTREQAIPPLNSIASETVRAERAVSVEDKAATQARRDAAAQASPPVFDYNPDLYTTLSKRFADAIDGLITRRDTASLSAVERRDALQKDLGRSVPESVFDALETLHDPHGLDAAAATLFGIANERMVIGNRTDLPAEGAIAIHDTHHDKIDKALVAGVLDLGQVRRLIKARAHDLQIKGPRPIKAFLVAAIAGLAEPNLTFNRVLTGRLAGETRQKVDPVMQRIEQGEVIVREGDRITGFIQERLRLLNAGHSGRSALGEALAVGGLMLALFMLCTAYFTDKRSGSRPGRKQIYMMLAVFGTTQIGCVAAWYAGLGVANGLGFPPDAAAFLPPVALASVIIALLVDLRASILVGIALAIVIAYRVDGDVWVLTNYIFGVLAAAISVRRCRRRSDLLFVSFVIAGAQLVLVPIMAALDTTLPADVISYFIAVAASGVVSALLISALVTIGLPLAEWLFAETTDMRLLELASADNPLLKQLALRSPGTYYHSMMMANLTEAAAEAIGVNGLQCRVMALYHDLGKMERPSYFAENQNGRNIHDRLPPELSARIIFAHIKDGIDIARKNRLGRPILDAITQHQGTTILRVFHQRALDRAKTTGEKVNEDEFRYPGPRPMTREAGILLFADSVEAATRALKDPNPADVRNRTATIIRDKIADHQLDDCPLTIKDIASIEAAFVRVLTLGVFHTRIEYPPPAPTESAPVAPS